MRISLSSELYFSHDTDLLVFYLFNKRFNIFKHLDGWPQLSTCIIGSTLIIPTTFLAQVCLWNASDSSHVGWWFIGSPSLERWALESIWFRLLVPKEQTETQTWEITLLQGHNKCNVTSSHKGWTFKDILLQCNGRLFIKFHHDY